MVYTGLDENYIARILSEALHIKPRRALSLASSRSIRVLRYRNITYIVLRRDIANFAEGTTIIVGEKDHRVIPGYPHIKRILLPSKALPSHFIDKIVVEEKMNGYNVRVFIYEGEIYAATRGGYICPYTTHRVRESYGENIRSLIEASGETSIVAGEVVGLQNPYTRYYYPEAPDWDFFVFDIIRDGRRVPHYDKYKMIEEYGLRGVRMLGVISKHDIDGLYRIMDDLEKEGREGVVMKDPLNRVEPLKYTTSATNIGDISIGMRAPFDEGRHFIFPRLLRELFMYYERNYSPEEIESKARKLGEALIKPALDSIKRFEREKAIGESFELPFSDYEFLEEFIDYMIRLGVDFSVISIEKNEGVTLFRGVKWMRETQRMFERILSTGVSPMD